MLFFCLTISLLNIYNKGELEGRNLIAYTDGQYYVYKCVKEAGQVLKDAANSLYEWIFPDLLEDLCFWDINGDDFLVTIQLEHLHISYTRIKELPPELEKLTRLRSLNMDNNLFTVRPTFLNRMANLEAVNISGATFFG